MNNPIDYAINRVKNFAIPPQLLQFLMNGRQTSRYRPTRSNLETLIREKIIEGRILPDCNILGPTETDVICQPSWYESLDDGSKILTIPLAATKGKKIVTVSKLLYSPGVFTSAANGHVAATVGGYNPRGSTMSQSLTKLADSHRKQEVASSTNMDIIGHNTILISSYVTFINNTSLSCRLEGDENLSFIKPGKYDLVAQMVELATKAYIYNNYELDVSQGAISQGRELTDIRDKVQAYASADEEYKTLYQERFRKAIRMNDPMTKVKQHRLISGGFR